MSAAVACALVSRITGLTAVDTIRDADVRPGALTVLVTPLPSAGNDPVAVGERRYALQILGRRTVGTVGAPAAGLPWAAAEALIERTRSVAERLDGRPLAVQVNGKREAVYAVSITNVGSRRPYPDESWGAVDAELGFRWNPALSAPVAAPAAGSPSTTP